MKKTLLFAVLFTASALSALATVNISIKSSGWGDATTLGVNGMAWGLVINSAGATFSPTIIDTLKSELLGFAVPGTANPSTPVQIGTSDLYYAAAATLTMNSGPPSFTDGYMFQAVFYLTAPVSTGDAYGILWFPDSSGTLAVNDSFGFTDLSATLPADGWTIDAPASTGTLANYSVIPEPAVAMLVGMAGLASVALRRRR